MKVLNPPTPEPLWTYLCQCPHCRADLEIDERDLYSTPRPLLQRLGAFASGRSLFLPAFWCGACKKEVMIEDRVGEGGGSGSPVPDRVLGNLKVMVYDS